MGEMNMMANYNLFLAQNQRIETERLVLRPVTLADADDLFAYSSNAENVYYVLYDQYSSIDDAYFSIANFFMQSPLGKYGIELKETGQLIGTIDIRIEPDKRAAEIGYILNRRFHRQGLMTEAAKALLKLGFEVLELEKMYAVCDSRNEASAGVMKKMGMTKEAERKHHSLSKQGEWIDMLEYAILREDYLLNK